MGMHLQVHVGAYIEAEVKEVEKTTSYIGCVVHGHKTGAFCDSCGAKIKEVERCEMVKPSVHMLLDGFRDEEALYQPLYDETDKIILLSNCGGALDISEGGDAVEITPEIASDCVSEFVNLHGSAIEYLLAKVISLEVKFGVVTYWL